VKKIGFVYEDSLPAPQVIAEGRKQKEEGRRKKAEGIIVTVWTI
jgi:hypothetical protein